MAKENNSIPEMDLNKYSEKKPVVPEVSDEQKKELDKTKKEIDKIKIFILKKYPFTKSLSILPPQGIKFFIDEEEIPTQTEKHVQLYMIIPEDNYKKIPEMTKEIAKKIEESKQKIWIQIKTPVDVWENCFDSKFELHSAIAMSFPLHDDGFLQGIRVAEIHKSLVVRKFEKYVVSYVVAGSLVRGEATKTSDVDVFVIINDTDVKRMPRLELKERLRSMIHQMVPEANAMAGVKENLLNIQPYLLTDFWDSVKDAHPVMFTFIRDGVPIYDKGTFMPWKALLKMGKLKPSPEAIDMFMSMGSKTVERAKRGLLDIFAQDIFWGVTYPAQAMLMLSGLPPPNAKKELVPALKKEYGDTKMLEKKYLDFIQKVVTLWRDYEHGKVKELSGKEIDSLIDGTKDYLERMNKLREQIEKKFQEKTIEQIYNDTMEMLQNILGKKTKIIEEFEEKMIKSGKFPRQDLKVLNDIVEAKKEFKKGKLNTHKADKARKDASVLINRLIEYSQRMDLVSLEKGKMILNYKENDLDKMAEILTCDDKTFLIKDNVVSLVGENGIEESSVEKLNEAIANQKAKSNVNINPHIFPVLEKELGKFEIMM